MKRTPKRIPETQKAISTNSKTLDEIIIILIMIIILCLDSRMTNSPWAVGTNGKFTESATFHNSARRQLSTKQQSNEAVGWRVPSSEGILLVPSCRGRQEETPTGHPVLQFSLFPTLSQPHPVNTNNNSQTQRDRHKAKTKDRRGKEEEEERDYKILMCLSIRHKLYNYHLYIYIIG